MIKRQASSGGDDILSPDLMPLLDVIFIILVFLLLTANAPLQTLNIDIPKVKQEQLLQPVAARDPLSLSLSPNAPHWRLNDKTFDSWQTLEPALLAQLRQNPDRPLIISGDRKATLQRFLRLIAFLQSHHIQHSKIVLEPESHE
ncbi:biopolymer transporter ExbD [Vibrio profundum]|uniref:ExbD/TolR family protein n=1 Tax=Vibrio profundum TaxID=2910247 RepID=UPI003D151D54